MSEITITYEIGDIKAYSDSERENIVKQVLFVIRATDGQNEKTAFFPVEFDAPQSKTFVEYGQLTKQQVIDWALAKIDPAQLDSLKNGLAGVVQEMSATGQMALVAMRPPWAE